MIGIRFSGPTNENFKINLRPPASAPAGAKNSYRITAAGPGSPILE